EGTLAPGGYNMTPGGDGVPKGTVSWISGKKHVPETLDKMSAAWTPERKAAHVARCLGKPMSAEAIANMTTASKRPERVAALRARNAVMNQTEEHKSALKNAWDEKRSLRI